MIMQSFSISKPEQVHRFQIRLPRTTKQVVAIDYDVFMSAVPMDGAGAVSENNIQFNWSSNMNPIVGRLKLQSLEKANIIYSEWLKLLEWNIGIKTNGIFPINPFTLLQKQLPKQVEVSPQTTILNGLYQDSILKSTNGNFNYTIKIFVWLEMNEENKGIEFEFLKPKKNE
jgi:hypothetical protein